MVINVMSSQPQYDDQTIFWRTLRSGQHARISPLKTCKNIDDTSQLISIGPANEKRIISCALDSCAFSSGALMDDEHYELFLESLRVKKVPMVTLHANYMVGNMKKMEKLKSRGFWMTHWPGSDECREHKG